MMQHMLPMTMVINDAFSDLGFRLWWLRQWENVAALYSLTIIMGSMDSSGVRLRAPDLWLKGLRFKSGGRLFFSRVNFLYWLSFHFQYPFHPCATAVAYCHTCNCKKSQSFCQKCSWQVTVNLLNTHAPSMYLRGFAWSDVTWCMIAWCT